MKSIKFAAIVLAVMSSLAVLASAQERRIVVFSQETLASERLSIAAELGSVVRDLHVINALVVEGSKDQMKRLDDSMNLPKMRSGTPKIIRVDQDPKINWLLHENLESLASQPLPSLSGVAGDIKSRLPRTLESAPASQEVPWGIKRVNAEKAWSVTRGEGVKVCVIDTGIDMTHPDLAANVKGGWNAISNSANFKDDNGHGSHVSGTIAAIDNDFGVIGVAPKASLYGVKVLDAGGSGTFDDVMAGMQWAIDNKMQVASMSLGADTGNDSLKEVVAAMAKSGVVLIAAAGNSGPNPNTVGYPAGYPGAIAIAAMTAADKVASFSSRGPQVALIAPGVGVNSTYKDGGYHTASGTSMATPHVSGLAALAIAAKGLSGYEAVRAALIKAATPIAGASKPEQGAGAIDAAKLVAP
jgi:subtilisin family serine protease